MYYPAALLEEPPDPPASDRRERAPQRGVGWKQGLGAGVLGVRRRDGS